ncbi:MAG: helix-turn-helix transcriptional regulator [Gammaproteobacteria bacterium]|nr:helix-turn-helix transcriptional regulator [Gammaproteobacteria bacterium]
MNVLNPMTNMLEWMPELLKTEFFHEFPFHYYVKDKRSILIACNNALAKTVGFEKSSDLIGMNSFDLCASPSHAIAIDKNDKLLFARKNKQIFIEKIMPYSRSETQTYLSYKIPLFSKNKVRGLVGISFAIDDLTNSHHLLPVIESQSTNLTARQLDCLLYLIKGHTIKQIANILMLSPKTVEHYLEACKEKLNCLTKSELIAAGLKLSVIRKKL